MQNDSKQALDPTAVLETAIETLMHRVQEMVQEAVIPLQDRIAQLEEENRALQVRVEALETGPGQMDRDIEDIDSL